MDLTELRASVVAANLPTSEKIRRLKQDGMRQADIARALGIRDQFVSNVVRRAARTGAPNADQSTSDRERASLQIRTQVGEGGRVVIPAAMRAALGLEVGDDVLLRLDGGDLRLLSAVQALREAQELVRSYVPRGTSLADELIAERRREAAGG
jgi:AbrB family looped-hinge helix DNA binding protein